MRRAWMIAMALLLMAPIAGCGAKLWPPMIVVGDSFIGANCKDSDPEQCEDVVRGGKMGGELRLFLEKVIDTAVMIAGKFIPGGLGPQAMNYTTPEPAPAPATVPPHTHPSDEIVGLDGGVTLEHVEWDIRRDEEPSVTDAVPRWYEGD